MKNKLLIQLTGVLILICSMIFLSACGSQEEDAGTDESQTETEEQQAEVPEEDVSLETYYEDVEENPTVTITMENGGEIVLELYPHTAPNTVANFISLVEDGFYDGTIFHRVIPGFMIQGGDPEGSGMGGPGYAIRGEFEANDFDNDLSHERGVVSMARSQDSNSAGSQFFIMVDDAPHLDGEYAAFGRVIEGMDIVDEIVIVDRDPSDKPFEDQVMETVTVDTKGYDYPEPETNP